MSLFICLEGVDAVGKTEIGQALARRLGYQYYKSPGEKFASMRDSVDTNVNPLMQAVMGLHVGESTEAVGPKGPVEYEVIALFADWDDVPEEFMSP